MKEAGLALDHADDLSHKSVNPCGRGHVLQPSARGRSDGGDDASTWRLAGKEIAALSAPLWTVVGKTCDGPDLRRNCIDMSGDRHDTWGAPPMSTLWLTDRTACG